jgi:HAD superfamily hydrolase (TIGR01548 family)
VSQPNVIVFDMDGVLVDVTESYREAIVRTVEHFTGRRIERSLIQEYKNSGGYNNDWKLSQRIAADLGVAVEYDTVVDYFNRIFLYSGEESLIHRERWIAGPELFPRLAQRFDFAIFTGRSRAEADLTLKRHAAGVRFHPIVCHDDVVATKPHPEGLLKIAAAFPGRTMWYVGDTVDDARCARAAGVDFIGVAAPGSPGAAALRQLLKAEGAKAVIDDINQLESVW